VLNVVSGTASGVFGRDAPVFLFLTGVHYARALRRRYFPHPTATASAPMPAKLLAVFVVDTNETELTTHSGTEVLIPFVRRYC
jgi:hypothetical protein